MTQDDFEEMLDASVSFHDRHHFEVKLDVNVPPDRSTSRYTVEAWLFVPRSLGVEPTTYPKERFYEDVQNWIRFKTPHVALGKLIDPSNELSPLYRARRAIDEILAGQDPAPRQARLLHEVRMLGCMVRSTTDENVRYLATALDACSRAPALRRARTLEVLDAGLNLVRELRALLREMRAVKVRLHNPIVPQKLRDAYEFMDEYASLAAEACLTAFLQSVAASAPEVRAELAPLEKAIRESLKSESAYRRESGHPSVITPGSDNEAYARRRSQLKKFISSVLFLQMEVRGDQRWREFLFGVAAAVAMLFWLGVTLAVQTQAGSDTVAVLAAAVVAYVFKDRMKAWLQSYFSEHMSRWLPDHRARIIDPDGGAAIGVFQEAFAYVDVSSVPADIARLRGVDPLSAAEEESRPPRVLKYEKEVTLYPKRIFDRHARLHSIADIIRFNVSHFLGRTDDPKTDHPYFSPETGDLARARLSRTYPTEVILRYRLFDAEGREEVRFERVRLILNRKGIKRLERVAERLHA